MSIKNVGDIQNFEYTGTVARYEVPISGKYRVKLWGAQGNRSNVQSGSNGGLGGYTQGEINLKQGDIIFVAIGNGGNAITNLAMFNGGGSVAQSDDGEYEGGSGGGATHVALRGGTLSELSGAVETIIAVAGGGGGSGAGSVSFNGGTGGGLNAGNGVGNDAYGGLGGTQETGYTFGIGASVASPYSGGAGGGGYFGGFAGRNYNGASGGGGGSGYIGQLENATTENGVRSGVGRAELQLIEVGSPVYLGTVAIDRIYLGSEQIDFQ